MPIFFFLPAYMLFTGTPIFFASAGQYFAWRGIYFLLTLATWYVMQYPISAAKYYKIWIGLSPVFAMATLKALWSREKKPAYQVTRKPGSRKNQNENGIKNWLRQFRAVSLQVGLFVINFTAIFYGIFQKTLTPELLLIASLWSVWVMWSLGGICKAALWPKIWPAETAA